LWTWAAGFSSRSHAGNAHESTTLVTGVVTFHLGAVFFEIHL